LIDNSATIRTRVFVTLLHMIGLIAFFELLRPVVVEVIHDFAKVKILSLQ